MMWPSNLFTIILIGLPILYAILIAFTNLKFASNQPVIFIALGNFSKAAHDPVFWTAVRVTLTIYVASLSLQLIIGTWIGIVLSSPLPGMRFLRVLSLFPFVMPPVASGLVWLQLFDPAQGFLNYALSRLSIPRQLWIAHPDTVLYSIILVEVWESTPFIALIIVGAMHSLPREPFEAAVMDGASKLNLLRYITLPLLLPAIAVAAILRSVDLLRIFDSIYILTQGGPVNASMSLNVYAYIRAFLYNEMAYSSTIMLLLLGMVLLISSAMTRIRRNYNL